MKQIVCPIDFSGAAFNASRYAGYLARDLQFGLVLIHIAQDVPLADYIKDAEEKLKTYAGSLEKEFKIHCRYVVKGNSVGISASLDKEIEDVRPNLVVMGTNGAEDMYQFFFGTHTYQVLRGSSRPLLIVPKECGFQKIKKIIYAIDYCPKDQQHLKELLQMTAPYHPELTILHVSRANTPVSDEVFRCFRNMLAGENEQQPDLHFKKMTSKDVSGTIHAAMREADMLVLSSQRYTLFERIFHQSIIRKISFIMDYPVLVYPHE